MTKGKFMTGRKKGFLILVIFIAFSLVNSAFAELVEYPWAPGLVYDTDQNITWLKDANYAKTSGYDDDGRMQWEDARRQWAENLVYESGGVMYDDWRLPEIKIGDNCWGYNCTSSEMGHLYYVELGGTAKNPPEDWRPFINVQLFDYWSKTWAFDFSRGYQGHK